VTYYQNHIGVSAVPGIDRGSGGGLFVDSAIQSLISGCYFQSNSASAGGGMFIHDEDNGIVTIRSTYFTHNTAPEAPIVNPEPFQDNQGSYSGQADPTWPGGVGGGLAVFRVHHQANSTSVYLVDVTMRLNQAANQGAAIFADNCALDVSGKSSFQDNHAPNHDTTTGLQVWPGSAGGQLTYTVWRGQRPVTLRETGSYRWVVAGTIYLNQSIDIQEACEYRNLCGDCALNKTCGWSRSHRACGSETSPSPIHAYRFADLKPGFEGCCAKPCLRGGLCSEFGKCVCTPFWTGEQCTRLSVQGASLLFGTATMLLLPLLLMCGWSCVVKGKQAKNRVTRRNFVQLAEEDPSVLGPSGEQVETRGAEDVDVEVGGDDEDGAVVPVVIMGDGTGPVSQDDGGVPEWQGVRFHNRKWQDKIWLIALILGALVFIIAWVASGRRGCFLKRGETTLELGPDMRGSVRAVLASVHALLLAGTASSVLGVVWIVAFAVEPTTFVLLPIFMWVFSCLILSITLSIYSPAATPVFIVIGLFAGPVGGGALVKYRQAMHGSLLRPIPVIREAARALEANLGVFIIFFAAIFLTAIIGNIWLSNLFYYACSGVEWRAVLTFFFAWWHVCYWRNITRFTIAGALANWYFSREPKAILRPFTFYSWGITRSSGSLAITSGVFPPCQFLTGLVRLIRPNTERTRVDMLQDRAIIHMAMFGEGWEEAIVTADSVASEATFKGLAHKLGPVFVLFKLSCGILGVFVVSRSPFSLC